MTEDQLISQLTQHLHRTSTTQLGPGDDCALIQTSPHTLFKVDTIIERVHFTSHTEPERVGWKAAARVISDIAVMGGTPQSLLIALTLPSENHTLITPDYLQALYRGLNRCAKAHGCDISGGETCSHPTPDAAESDQGAHSPLIITVSGIGTLADQSHLTRRSTAQSGDTLYVTGHLGGSFPTGKHLDFTPRLTEAQWLVKHHLPTAMMDLSDGLAKDLPRLASASQLHPHLNHHTIPITEGFTLDHALTDGEDYELLFSYPKGASDALEHAWQQRFPDLPLTAIGTLEPSPATGTAPLQGGYDHLQR